MKVAIVGPVFPFRAGIAYCTTRLAEELDADVDLVLAPVSEALLSRRRRRRSDAAAREGATSSSM